MKEDKSVYYAYLLRLWQADEANGIVWRASLETPGKGERLGFKDLEALWGYLKRQLGEADLPGPSDREVEPRFEDDRQ